MKMMLQLLCLLAGVGKVGLGTARAQQVTVASDGSAQFRTIQAALNSLSAEAARPRTVYVKNGTYREKVSLDGKSKIILKGQSEKGVILTLALAREAWRCDPAANNDDWGVATLNLRNAPDITLENLTVVNSYGFDAAGDATIACPTEPGGTKTISKTSHQMALRTFPGTVRLVARHCTFRALGGDTVSPWDTEAGQYYFKDCTMEGGVDFYCPRGWAYAENCRFECHSTSAAIWHDGSGNKDAKTVLKNCTFVGDAGFKLGRFHREAQFYLLNCRFAKTMADSDIYYAQSGPGARLWGRRVYYANCHRTGGDYAWHRDNLSSAAGVPKAQDITPEWTFDGRWNPLTGRVREVKTTVVTDSIAEKMLVYQRAVGGWPKAVGDEKVNYDHPLSTARRAATLADKQRPDATIDNHATTREIEYLAQAFQRTSNPAYRQAAERGVRYLLQMQQPSGGFPQFYPDSSHYRHQITYNDDAMVRALSTLRDVAWQHGAYASLDFGLVGPARAAVERGIGCILRTQYRQRGTLTAWCAQHDAKTLLPTQARAFELASLSGMETVGIVRFLMEVEQPSAEVRQAVEAAVAWLEKVKISGYDVRDVPDTKQPRGFDRVLVPEAGATIWARFYDLDTNQPIYVGRDGQKHTQLSDIEVERRTGYAYVGTWPTKLLTKEYPAWQKRVNAPAPK
jgi:PelA/Pel-15E family pectate lyase